MPELPEVETVARMLAPRLVGRTIREVEVAWERSIAVPAPAEFGRNLVGARLTQVSRRGKYLIFALQPQAYLLTHLRMSGRYLLDPHPLPLHWRVVFRFVDEGTLVFEDPRKFGRLALVADWESALAALGPEPLAPDFTVERLAACLNGRKMRLKVLLLDQSCVAGLGNIYVSEVLWQAGLAPNRAAHTLTAEEVARLHSAIQSVLRAAIHDGGTSLEDRQYVFPDGGTGRHQLTLKVYGRAGAPCPRCGAPIQRERIAQRSSYFCAHCQQ